MMPPKEKATVAFNKRVAKVFADRVDPTETLLTEKQYDALQKRLVKLIDQLNKGNCDGFDELRGDMVAWQQDMEKYAKKTVTKKFKVDKKRKLVLDPEKRPRPKNEKAQTKLRRALLEFQMANYLANGTKKDEARTKLIHRYELATKRVKELDSADIFGMYLNAYASALDPHTTYFSAEDLEDFQISMQLSLQGIGARLISRDGFTTIEELVPGGAADKQGMLKPKDQIVAVAQGEKGEPVDVIDMDLRDVVKLIRGKKGTKVTLSILRKGKKTERLNITIVRDKIDLTESAASLKWREVKRGNKKLKIAVIDLPSFYQGQTRSKAGSSEDVAKLLKEAKSKGADGVMLDLSRNGGGLLSAAVEISGFFIEAGAIVGVGTIEQARAEVLDDRDIRVIWDGPLVVLTSKLSASASEILAGALQDYGRAVIVGDKSTFGKGTVQQMNPLPPGLGAIKVTTSMFYLPGGMSTQSIGVSSDIVVPSIFSNLEIGESYQDFAVPSQKTKEFLSPRANANRKWTPVTKAQMNKLSSKSSQRIKKSKEFKELKQEIAKNDPQKTITLGDILKDSKSEEELEKEKKKDEKELSIQAKEATEILADLITMK